MLRNAVEVANWNCIRKADQKWQNDRVRFERQSLAMQTNRQLINAGDRRD